LKSGGEIMGNTYTQLIYHITFSVKHRLDFIKPTFENELYSYIGGIIKNRNGKLYSIGGTENHIHILAGFRPERALSDLVKEIKIGSTKFINENSFLFARFAWQEGFGCFTCKKSDVPRISEYIQNQKEHHKKFNFKEEFKRILDELGIEYDEKYLFDN
jgi:putative transposase